MQIVLDFYLALLYSLIQYITFRCALAELWIVEITNILSIISSAEQLIDIGCQWVILGHSERRHVIGEDDQVLV